MASPSFRAAVTALAAVGALLVAAAPATAQDEPQARSSLVGTVVDHESNAPVAGAAVSLAPGPGGTKGMGTRVSNQEGRFLFRDVPPGTYRVVVTSLGYRSLRDTLTVEDGLSVEVVLPLSVEPIALSPLIVEARRLPRGAMRDFEARRRTRIGTFIEREEIEARHAARFSDLLLMVPGVRVTTGNFGRTAVRMRGGCQPELVVDGVPTITIEDVDNFILPDDVEALEIYRGVAMPVEFGSSSCGAVVVWTRRGEPTPDMGGFWKRAAAALTFLALGFFLTR